MNLLDYFDNGIDYDRESSDIYEEFARRALERDDLEEYYESKSEDEVLASMVMYDYTVRDHAEVNSEDDEGGDDL